MKKYISDNLSVLLVFLISFWLVSCSNDDTPELEVEEEVINKIVLEFVPESGETVQFTWFDSDGDGVASPTIDSVELEVNTSYTLNLELTNTLGGEDEDVTEEIESESDEHMFFFSFTEDVFSDPVGNGNYDNRGDSIRYNDSDVNGYGVGLSTLWTTGEAVSSATFTIVLMHQPELKTAVSDVTVGSTDINISFPLEIK